MSETMVPIPIVAARGVPQTVPVDAAGRRFSVTLSASVADVPALRSIAATDVLVDAVAEQQHTRNSVPGDARSWMVGAAPSTVSADLVRPHLAVREDGVLLGSRPVIVGRELVYGHNEGSPLVIKVTVQECTLTAASLIRPGETGGRFAAELRICTSGVSRNEATATIDEEDPYGQLA
ncbi:hypothetical protein [Ilumatobacter sp.]|uniref:hypothetical protein n=1 Tax=Ilumatobacter sp. TaxID=1967498 RepID=UPI003B517F78